MRLFFILMVTASCRLAFDETRDAVDDAAPAAFVPTWKSGTRIRARVLHATEGGDPIFIGWRDSQLANDCRSGIASDGVERCVPAAVLGNEFLRDEYYSDAACTKRLAFVRDSICGAHTFAAERSADLRFHEFPILGKYLGPIYDGAAGCSATVAPINGTMHAVGPEEPAASFLPTVYDTVRIGDNLRVIAGFIDGSTELLTQIVVGGRACLPTGGRLGVTRCHEPLPALRPVFSDAACTTRAYLGPPQIVDFEVDDLSLCGESYSRLTITSTLAVAAYYEQPGCVMHPLPALSKLYAASAALDPFPSGTVAPGPRRGRLGRVYWTSSDVIPIDLGIWDHDLARPCQVFRATDNVLRCLPSGPQRVIVASPGDACAALPRMIAGSCFAGEALDGPTYSSCTENGWDVQRLPLLAQTASSQIEGTCAALDQPANGVFGFADSGALSPAMFPALIESIE